MLWDKMYYGCSYNDVKELYYDICQLDVMSGIEIDKAKKEFDIDNSKELDRLREKYKSFLLETKTDENGNEVTKKKMPHFFSHISRQKGYYNPKKKDYCKYHTSMDYLQTIVNGFKIKNPYKKDWLPFVSILDNSLFRTNNINQEQIDKIYRILRIYISDRRNIFGSELDKDDKFLKSQLLYNNLVSEIESEIIGFSTLFRLLSSLEDKENSQIKNTLLQVLYLCGNKSFNKAIINSSSEIKQLELNGNDIELFGIRYKIEGKVINSKK